MEPCLHTDFDVVVNVLRLKSQEDGPVTHYSAEVRIICHDCKVKFEFIGIGAGYRRDQPTTSIDFTTVHLPIIPESGQIAASASYQIGQEEKKDTIVKN